MNRGEVEVEVGGWTWNFFGDHILIHVIRLVRKMTKNHVFLFFKKKEKKALPSTDVGIVVIEVRELEGMYSGDSGL